MYQVWRNKKKSINRIVFCQLKFLKHTFLSGAMVLLTVLVGAVSGSFFSQARFSVKDVRHIILISIDTCRADYLSCYGYPLPTTPNIDRFAQENILFTDAVKTAERDLKLALVAGQNELVGNIRNHLEFYTRGQACYFSILSQKTQSPFK